MRRLPGGLYQMKNTLQNAIRLTELLQHDIARISANGTTEQQRLAAICADNRLTIANCLWHIQSLEPATKKPTVIPSTPEQSEELRKLDEQSFKAGDFNPGDINETDDQSWLARQMAKHENAHAAYRRKVNRVGWILAATAAGVLAGVVKILTDLF